MTKTEIVMVKLFGWELSHPFPGHTNDAHRWYHRGDYSDGRKDGYVRGGQWVAIDTKTGNLHWQRHAGGAIPDFTDERLKWYWIRQVEDAIFRQGVEAVDCYVKHLQLERYGSTANTSEPVFATAVLLMCATVEQRLAAAVKVLEEQG